jgi:hypothetical protein
MPVPSWLIWYKKPEYRDIKEYATALGTGSRSSSPDARGKTSIPSRLVLDRILQNKTCMSIMFFDDLVLDECFLTLIQAAPCRCTTSTCT